MSSTQSGEAVVVALFAEVRNGLSSPRDDDEDAFDAIHNAGVAANAEHYYRVMVRADRQPGNIRDHHMADRIDRLSRHLGPAPKANIWEHNTHVGDARATDMTQDGLVNGGQLLRVYHPEREDGNYAPTRMGERYDALNWLEHAAAPCPVQHEGPPREPEFETKPSWY